VPWASLLGSEADYVDPKYVPVNFTFKEPSKLSKQEALDRLKFWYGRQEDPKIKTVFQFQKVLGRDGEPESLPDAAEPRKKKASRSKRPTKLKKADGKKQRQRKQPVDSDASDSSASEDSAKSSSTDSDPEEDAEVEGEVRNRRGRKEPLVLPFSAVRVERPGAPVKRPAAGAPKPRSRYEPSAGPQFERPRTRTRAQGDEEVDEEEEQDEGGRRVSPRKKGSGRVSKNDAPANNQEDRHDALGSSRKRRKGKPSEDEEEQPARKKSKREPPVQKFGPPKGIPKDGGRSKGKGKGKARN